VDAHAAHAKAYLDLPQQLPISLAPQLDRAIAAASGDGVDSLQLHNDGTRDHVLVRLAAEQAFGHA
jgi:hypothetical protein